MPTCPIKMNPQRAADKALSWYWGRVYAGLMEEPTNKSWYIDERADPKNFWVLLAIAQPEVWMMRKNKDHIPIGHLAKAVRFMRSEEHRVLIIQAMMDNDDGE